MRTEVRSRVWATAASALVTALLVGCSADAGAGAGVETTSDAEAIEQQRIAEDDATATASPDAPVPERAAFDGSIPPAVDRKNQVPPEERLGSEPAAPTEGVEFEDGLGVTVSEFASGVIDDTGPGVFAGQEYVTFTLTVRNGTDAAIPLHSVVLSVLYGDGVAGAPVYDGTTADLYVDLQPGAVADARYGFAVPAGERDEVEIHVDLDGFHAPAQFVGALPGV